MSMTARRLYTVGCLLFMTMGMVAQEQQTPPPVSTQVKLTRAQKRRMKEAEALADRAVARLHETMDFATVYDELFVPDAVWRYRKAKLWSKQDTLSKISEEMQAGCDDENLRRLFVSQMNLMWGILAYYYATQDLTKADAPDLSAKLYPEDVVRTTAETRFFSALAREDDRLPDIESREQLLQAVTEAERVSEALLKALPTDAFTSERYRENVKQRLAKHKSRVTRETGAVYLDEPVDIYVVERDLFRFHVVHYQGEWKLIECSAQID